MKEKAAIDPLSKMLMEQGLKKGSNDRQAMEKLKGAGDYLGAGKLAHSIGLGRGDYGVHYGMKSNRDAAIREFQKGWDSAKSKAGVKEGLTEAAGVKPNPKQLAVLAAILGISNAGLDYLFVGNRPEFTPEKAKKLCDQGVSVENAVVAIASGYFETEEMADGFVEEAKDWVKTLKNMTLDDIKKTFKRYAPYVDAIT